jgi:hypothetical protein
MKRQPLGTQGSLFGDPGSVMIEIRPRTPAAPFGVPDKSGRRFWERLRDEVESLPDGTREAALVVLLSWPGDRRDALRKILDRFARAEELERDNFREAMGW